MNRIFHKVSHLLALLLFASTLNAQSQFEITIQQFDSDEVRGYVQPLGDMFGANMNAGLFHSAYIPPDGFHFRIDVVGMISVVADEHRTYDATLPAGFIPEGGSRKTATVFGGRGTTFKDANSGLEYKGSDGFFSTDIFPLIVPQVTLGTLWGTQAIARYISTPSFSDGLPNSTLWGIGLRHSISRYFGPTPPFDACIGAFYSSFAAEDLMDFDGVAIDLQVSKAVSLLTFYGSIAYEKSSMRLHYAHKADEFTSPKLVDIEIDGGNSFRMTTGLQIDLQAIKLYADVNFGYVHHFSGGIGFGF